MSVTCIHRFRNELTLAVDVSGGLTGPESVEEEVHQVRSQRRLSSANADN